MLVALNDHGVYICNSDLTVMDSFSMASSGSPAASAASVNSETDSVAFWGRLCGCAAEDARAVSEPDAGSAMGLSRLLTKSRAAREWPEQPVPCLKMA